MSDLTSFVGICNYFCGYVLMCTIIRSPLHID